MKPFATLFIILPTALAAVRGLRKRDDPYVYTWTAGTFGLGAQASDTTPWLVLSDQNYPQPAPANTEGYFYFNPSNGYVHALNYETHGASLCKVDPGQPAITPGDCTQNTCDLEFGEDGNLVYYFNGNAIWNSGTGGSGAVLQANPESPFLQINDAGGNVIWYSDLPSPPNGPPGPICEGSCPPCSDC